MAAERVRLNELIKDYQAAAQRHEQALADAEAHRVFNEARLSLEMLEDRATEAKGRL